MPGIHGCYRLTLLIYRLGTQDTGSIGNGDDGLVLFGTRSGAFRNKAVIDVKAYTGRTALDSHLDRFAFMARPGPTLEGRPHAPLSLTNLAVVAVGLLHRKIERTVNVP